MDSRTVQTRAPGERSFATRVVIVVGIVTLALVLLWFLRQVLDILMLGFAALLIATLVRSAVDGLKRFLPLSERIAFALVLLASLGILAGVLWWVVPRLLEQISILVESFPSSLDALQAQVRQLQWGDTLLEQMPNPGELLPNRVSLFSRLTGFASTGFSFLTTLTLVVAVGFYMAAQPDLYRRGLLGLVPPRHRAHIADVMDEIGEMLKQWVRGRGLAMLLDGVITALGLWLLGMPLVLVLTLIEVVMLLVPFVGTLLGAIPAVLVAWATFGTTKAIQVALLYLVIELLETYVVTPLVQHHVVELLPAIVILAAVMLGVVVGPLGVVLATPLVAVGKVLVNRLYVEDVLGAEAAETS